MTELNFTQVLTAVAQLAQPYSSNYSPNNPMANFLFPDRRGAFDVVTQGIQRQFGVEISAVDFARLESVGTLATMVAMALNSDQAVPQIVNTVIQGNRVNPASALGLDVELTDNNLRGSQICGTSGLLKVAIDCEEYFGVEIGNESLPRLKTGNDIVQHVRQGLLAAAR